MVSQERSVSYKTENIYLTLNTLTSKTKNVWLAFHGIGYLSRYFSKYFDGLDATENYIIIPQAPSKYYLDNQYKYVGASWLTREYTNLEIANVLNYVDAVFEAEKIPADLNLILFGFSQGVSIATRWLVHRKIQCKSLILFAGGIPNELTKADFDFLDWNRTSVKIVYGNRDRYLNEERMKKERVKAETLFQGHAEMVVFDGAHEMKPEMLPSLI